MATQPQQTEPPDRIDHIPTAQDLGIEEREISRRVKRTTKERVRLHSFEGLTVVGEKEPKHPST
jgi:hypothetical protein